jgi:hypothetical protein
VACVAVRIASVRKATVRAAFLFSGHDPAQFIYGQQAPAAKFRACLLVRYSSGYGENALDYNQESSALRVGIATD